MNESTYRVSCSDLFVEVVHDEFLHLGGLLVRHDADGELADHLARDHRLRARLERRT